MMMAHQGQRIIGYYPKEESCNNDQAIHQLTSNREQPTMAAMSRAKEPSPKAKQQEVAATIAEKLGETEPGPLTQISMVVRKLGPEQALAFLQETLAIEEKGGLMLSNGSRRRSPGGVFFFLGKTKGPKEVRDLFFQKKPQHKEKQAPQERDKLPS
jgi:hypothetical protein